MKLLSNFLFPKKIFLYVCVQVRVKMLGQLPGFSESRIIKSVLPPVLSDAFQLP